MNFRLSEGWSARDSAVTLLSDIKDDLDRKIIHHREQLKGKTRIAEVNRESGAVNALMSFREYLSTIDIVDP